VLSITKNVDAWRPPAPATAPPAALSNIPADSAARRSFDAENAEALAKRLPDSPLLEALRTELERARIIDLRGTDPKAAADLLIDLGRRSGGGARWSPDLLREYLGLADELAEGTDPSSALRLASEALRIVGASFQTPIHNNAEASGLYRRAADIVAANVASTPRDVAAAAMDGIDLSFVAYTYDNLPGTKAEAESKEAQQILETTARMAEAVAKNGDDAAKWNRLRGLSLLWQGVLINDSDSSKAAPVLRASADILHALVDADPNNAEVRYRYAEALRWVGIAEPSSHDTAETEREGVRQYKIVWENRASLDPALLGRVGAGYGYGLANLAQTIRETELADMSDGRTAEEHAGWVLDLLALEAEKDTVNAAMIETGAASGDSGFVGGWYSMSSYGWPIGFLTGLLNIESGRGFVRECDLLAADPYDPLRRAPGVALDHVDMAKAEPACRTESDGNPGDARAGYQLARVISADKNRESEFMSLARAAADAGVSPAFSLVANTLNDKSDDRSGEAYLAASQRTIIESFPILYPFLQSHAKTDRERVGLNWYVAKAAGLGVAQAHLALAESAPDLRQKLFHLLLAARLADDAGDAAAAADARQKAQSVLLRQVGQQRVEADVADWKPESLIALPADNPSAS